MPQSEPCAARAAGRRLVTSPGVVAKPQLVDKPLYLSLLRLGGLDGGDALQLSAARRLLRVHARRPLRHVPQLILRGIRRQYISLATHIVVARHTAARHELMCRPDAILPAEVHCCAHVFEWRALVASAQNRAAAPASSDCTLIRSLSEQQSITQCTAALTADARLLLLLLGGRLDGQVDLVGGQEVAQVRFCLALARHVLLQTARLRLNPVRTIARCLVLTSSIWVCIIYRRRADDRERESLGHTSWPRGNALRVYLSRVLQGLLSPVEVRQAARLRKARVLLN